MWNEFLNKLQVCFPEPTSASSGKAWLTTNHNTRVNLPAILDLGAITLEKKPEEGEKK
jgi:hypothetical protein